MTLSVITQDEVLTVRVYKQYSGYAWANNYEVQATQDISNPATSLEYLALRLRELEVNLYFSFVIIDRITISTYVPDSQPYNPNTLAVFPLSAPGTRNPSSDPLPLEMCLFVRRNSVFGRDGRLLYRGCLTEEEVTTSALRPILVPATRTSFQNFITNWSTVGLGAEWRFVLASGTPIPTDIRPVTNLQVVEKVVVKKFNNRYYRRRP